MYPAPAALAKEQIITSSIQGISHREKKEIEIKTCFMLDIRLGTRVVLFISTMYTLFCAAFLVRVRVKKRELTLIFVDCGHGPPIRARWNTSHCLRRQR